MAPFLLLLVLLAEAASDQIVVVRPGDDVILPCRAAHFNIRAVEWTRPDLEPDIVLLNIDGYLQKDQQNPSFKDRVDLVDRDLKDGNVSLILKNVNINDAGTYECGVKTDGSGRRKILSDQTIPIRKVHLKVTDLKEVTVRPGKNATLVCKAADSSVRVVKWSRLDLEPDIVLYYNDGHLETDEQNPDFRDRVHLVDRDLKDGDVSLTLKNVTINDAGTYECGVKTGELTRTKRDIHSDPIRTIRTIHLQVTGEKSAYSKDENPKNVVPEDGPSSPGDRHHGLAVGVVVGLVLVAAVAGVLMYKRHKDKRPGPPAADDDDEASGEKFV